MGDLTDIVAGRLRRARTDRGWTQEDLAAEVGLSVRYIGQVERRQASPSVRVLGQLADALKIEPAELVRRAKQKDKAKT
jgi:transcriptional regulator with XRE-family HTH domain